MSNRQATVITASTKTSGPGLYLVKTAGVTITLETWTHWPDISQAIVIKDQTGQTNPNITILPPGVTGYAPLGLSSFYSGTTAAPVAQATTTYLGQLGAAANYLNTAFVVGMPQTVTGAAIAVDTTPAAGQTMIFTLYDNATSLGSCTVSNGGFGCTITASGAAVVSDCLYIKSVFSATSASANVRYTINYRG